MSRLKRLSSSKLVMGVVGLITGGYLGFCFPVVIVSIFTANHSILLKCGLIAGSILAVTLASTFSKFPNSKKPRGKQRYGLPVNLSNFASAALLSGLTVAALGVTGQWIVILSMIIAALVAFSMYIVDLGISD